MAAPLFVLLLAAVLGVWLSEALALPPWAWAALWASLIAAAALGWAARCAPYALSFGMVALGYALAASLSAAPPCPSERVLERAEGGAYCIARIVAPLTRRCWGERCRLATQLELLAIERAETGGFEATSGRVALALWEPEEPPARGDVVQLVLRRRLAKPRSPWSPSAAQLARRRGAYAALLEAPRPHATLHYAQSWQAHIDRLRLRVARAFDQQLAKQASGIVRALSLGDMGALGISQRQAWADAGLAHLLAISGLHVGLIFALCERLVRLALVKLLGVRLPSLLPLAGCCALVGVWLYVLLAAVPTAALRAALMLTAATLARVLGRAAAGLQILGACGLFILTLWPLEAAGPSFVLSFAAVAGLLHAGDDAFVLGASSPQRAGRSRLARMGAQLLASVRMSVVATLTTLPACIYFFGRISWVGPIANIVAVPLAAMLATPVALFAAVMLCTAALLERAEVFAAGASWIAHRAVPMLLGLLEPLLVVLDRWAAGCARILGGAWTLPPHGRLGALGFVVAATALMLWSATRCRGRYAFGCLALSTVLMACGDVYDATLATHPGELQIYHLDVGQGDATLVRLPDGRDVLVDGGGALYGDAPDPGALAVAPALEALGVRRLAGVLVTHAHPDHIGGLAHVLSRWPCERLWRSHEAHESYVVKALEQIVRAQGGEVLLPPDELEWGEVSLRFVGALKGEEASANDHSTVLEITFGERRVTLMADIEERAENNLLGTLRPTEIIKVGHHGSRTSSHDALLEQLAPQVGVISCGANNSFGFPHRESVGRLRARNIALMRTDRLGTVGYASDGGPWRLLAAEGQWQNTLLLPFARRQR